MDIYEGGDNYDYQKIAKPMMQAMNLTCDYIRAEDVTPDNGNLPSSELEPGCEGTTEGDSFSDYNIIIISAYEIVDNENGYHVMDDLIDYRENGGKVLVMGGDNWFTGGDHNGDDLGGLEISKLEDLTETSWPGTNNGGAGSENRGAFRSISYDDSINSMCAHKWYGDQFDLKLTDHKLATQPFDLNKEMDYDGIMNRPSADFSNYCDQLRDTGLSCAGVCKRGNTSTGSGENCLDEVTCNNYGSPQKYAAKVKTRIRSEKEGYWIAEGVETGSTQAECVFEWKKHGSCAISYHKDKGKVIGFFFEFRQTGSPSPSFSPSVQNKVFINAIQLLSNYTAKEGIKNATHSYNSSLYRTINVTTKITNNGGYLYKDVDFNDEIPSDFTVSGSADWAKYSSSGNLLNSGQVTLTESGTQIHGDLNQELESSQKIQVNYSLISESPMPLGRNITLKSAEYVVDVYSGSKPIYKGLTIYTNPKNLTLKIIDTQPPITHIEQHKNWLNSTQEILTWVEDPGPSAGINWTKFCKGDSCTPSNNISTPKNISVSSDGKTYIRARSKDNAGNLGPMNQSIIKIDTHPPDVTCLAHEIKPSGKMILKASIDDSKSGIDVSGYDEMTAYKGINKKVEFCSASDPDEECSFNLNNFYGPCYFSVNEPYKIWAHDNAGNSGSCKNTFTRKMDIKCDCDYSAECLSGRCIGGNCAITVGPEIFID